MKHRLFPAALCLLAAALGVRVVSAMTEGRLAPIPLVTAAAAPQQAEYVGSDTCTTCHSDKEQTLKGTPHAEAHNPRAPAATHGCESCHGPGKAHVDDDAKGHINKFGQMKPAAISETCMSCHNRGTHAGWEGSKHEQRNLS